jgi:hypothetical protein
VTARTTRQLGIGAADVRLTLVSGPGDSYGFNQVTGVRSGAALVGSAVARSAIGFAIGIVSYRLVGRYLAALGVRPVTHQTPGWFAVTIVGVTVISAALARWSPVNKVIALAIVTGVSWLLVDARAA